jgi:DNA-binding MarR family transcriptional regulator
MATTKAGVEQRLLPLLEHLARVGRRTAETSMSPGGLRPRHLIALKLLSERGPASQQGLADALSLDPSNVVGLLNELEERELITRRRDPADRRRHIVELPPSGEDELALAYAQLCQVEDDLLSALSAEEGHALRPARPRGRCQVTSMRRCRRIARQPRLIQQTHRQQPSAANVACRRNR